MLVFVVWPLVLDVLVMVSISKGSELQIWHLKAHINIFKRKFLWTIHHLYTLCMNVHIISICMNIWGRPQTISDWLVKSQWCDQWFHLLDVVQEKSWGRCLTGVLWSTVTLKKKHNPTLNIRQAILKQPYWFIAARQPVSVGWSGPVVGGPVPCAPPFVVEQMPAMGSMGTVAAPPVLASPVPWQSEWHKGMHPKYVNLKRLQDQQRVT